MSIWDEFCIQCGNPHWDCGCCRTCGALGGECDCEEVDDSRLPPGEALRIRKIMHKIPVVWPIGHGCPVCGSRDYYEIREEAGTHDVVQPTFVVEYVCEGCSVKFDDAAKFGDPRKGLVVCCGKENPSDVGRNQGQDRQGS
jgi:hypothetical protein